MKWQALGHGYGPIMILLEFWYLSTRIREPTRNLNLDGQCPMWDSNRAHTKCKSWCTPLHQHSQSYSNVVALEGHSENGFQQCFWALILYYTCKVKRQVYLRW